MSVNDLSLNLWYSGLEHKKTSPLIVELTFNYEAKKLPERNKARLEEFPLSAVQKANNFYISLQNQKNRRLNYN